MVILLVIGLVYYSDHKISTLEQCVSEMEEAAKANTSAIYRCVESMDEGLTPHMEAMEAEIKELNESVGMMRQDMNELVSSLNRITKTMEEIIGLFTDLSHNLLVRTLCLT